MRVAAEIALSKEERRRLETWATTRSTSVRLRERARIVLMAAEGMTNKDIAAKLEVDANKVGRWRAHVAKEGTPSIEKERPRGANHGSKNTKKQAQLRSEVVEATTQTTPNDATHWSCRSMARHLNTTLRIPVQLDHRFRRKSITDSDSTRSLIPAEADHRFRCQADHFSAMTGIVHGVRGEGARGAG